MVTWEAEDADGSSYGVMARRFDSQGNPLAEEFPVNTTIESHQVNPAIATLPNGEFVVTWQSYWQDGKGYGVYGQRFDAQGEKLGAEFPLHNVDDAFNSHEWFTSVASSTVADNFLTVWQAANQDSSEYGVFGQLFENEAPAAAPNVAPELSQIEVVNPVPFVHQGSRDPRTEGWSTTVNPQDNAARPVDGAWLLDNSAATEGTGYWKQFSLAEGATAQEHGWTINTTLQLLDPSSRATTTFKDGFTAYTIALTADAENNLQVHLTPDAGAEVITLAGVAADEAHDYAIAFDPESDTVSILVDGVARSELTGYSGYIASGQYAQGPIGRSVSWGTVGTEGRTQWEVLEFEIHQDPPTQHQPHTISYTQLLANADVTDANGGAISFQIEEVTDGQLTKNGQLVNPGETLLSPGDELVWTPETAGQVTGFTVRATDGELFSTEAVDVNFTVR